VNGSLHWSQSRYDRRNVFIVRRNNLGNSLAERELPPFCAVFANRRDF
jgi:hypothetical protein